MLGHVSYVNVILDCEGYNSLSAWWRAHGKYVIFKWVLPLSCQILLAAQL
jgi:hypothetical protein